jgi:hypothetical protein
MILLVYDPEVESEKSDNRANKGIPYPSGFPEKLGKKNGLKH